MATTEATTEEGRRTCGPLCVRVALAEARGSEIGNLEHACVARVHAPRPREHQIIRLDVPVHDPVRVEVLETHHEMAEMRPDRELGQPLRLTVRAVDL